MKIMKIWLLYLKDYIPNIFIPVLTFIKPLVLIKIIFNKTGKRLICQITKHIINKLKLLVNIYANVELQIERFVVVLIKY
jgi:hypothetical protein